MRLEWKIEPADVVRLQAFVSSQEATTVVRVRRAVNLASTKPVVTENRLWKALVCMRLTTQQKSGPESHVSRFSRKNPFPLSLEVVKASPSTSAFITTTLTDSGGI